MKLVEQIGSEIRRIHDACTEHGVEDPIIQVEPDWVTVTFPRSATTMAHHETLHDAPHVTPHVERLISVLRGEMSRAEIMREMRLADRSHFRGTYLQPGLDASMVQMTVPDRPRSRSQRYRLTPMGRKIQESQEKARDDT